MLVFASLFISVNSILIFLLSSLWKLNGPVIIFSSLISFLICLWSYKKKILNLEEEKTSFISKMGFFVLTIPFLSLILFILSPLIFPIKVEGINFLRFPGVGDYNKHLYVTNAIYRTGIPPLHPYYPLAHLSYYFGYYIIPASASLVFKIPTNISLVGFITLTLFLSFGLIYKTIKTLIASSFLRLLALFSLITGTGLDIFPTILVNKFFFANSHHIELWPKILGANLMVTNTPVAALWVPQHFFAASLALYTTLFLLEKEKFPIIPLSFICSFIFFSSTFVAFTFFFWLSLIFAFKPKLRKQLFISGMLGIILIYPYLINLFRAQSPSLFQVKLISNSKLPVANFLKFLTFLFFNIPLEFGLPLFLLGLIFLKEKNGFIFKLPFLLGFILPLSSIIFISSANWNDYGMRSVLPLQLAIPIVLIYLLEKMKNSKQKRIFIFLILINLLISLSGVGFEFYWRWKERKLLSVEESLLLQKLREEKTEIISTLDTSFWAPYIPILSSHPLYSPAVHDSRVYLPEKAKEEIEAFGKFIENTFENPEFGKENHEIIRNKNLLLENFPGFIKKIPSSLFIIRNHSSYLIKGWLSPYKVIFDQISSPINYSLDFSAYNLDETKNKISNTKISISEKPFLVINPQKTNKLYLKKGLYFLVACKFQAKEQEIEILNRLLFKIPKDQNCAGHFFAPEEEGIYEITEKQVLTSFQAFPVEIYNLGK